MKIYYPPPQFCGAPIGEKVDFSAICEKAGLRMPISVSKLPDVRLHREAVDFKAVAPGRVAYCVGLPLLAGDYRQKSRMILDKLAYQFHDWASREVLGAEHRRVARGMPEAAEKIRTAFSPAASKIFNHLRAVGSSTVGELAQDLDVAQPQISRAIKHLIDADLISTRRNGREVHVSYNRVHSTLIDNLMQDLAADLAP